MQRSVPAGQVSENIFNIEISLCFEHKNFKLKELIQKAAAGCLPPSLFCHTCIEFFQMQPCLQQCNSVRVSTHRGKVSFGMLRVRNTSMRFGKFSQQTNRQTNKKKTPKTTGKQKVPNTVFLFLSYTIPWTPSSCSTATEITQQLEICR